MLWTNVAGSWALFIGIGFLMLGNGLQGTLLGVRADLEGFPTFITGVMMSGYFVGIFVGSLLAPKMVKRVGHIRVFGALASLASVAILIHGIFVNPVSWASMRFLTGLSYAGIYVVCESWLNERSDNQTRGKMLSLYMVVSMLGMGSGQFFINLADPAALELFIFVSVVVSLGMMPMLLTARPAPAFELSGKMTLKEVYQASPLGLIANTLTGMAHGTLFGLGAVYASKIGMPVSDIAIFMASFTAGALCLQWPIGYISDRMDRRILITIIAGLSTLLAVTLAQLDSTNSLFLVLTVALGGLAIPMYSLCISYVNDRLEVEQIVPASGTLVMCAGVGLSIGPVLVSFLMSEFGPYMYFYGIASSFGLIVIVALLRMSQSDAVAVDEMNPTVAVGQIGTPVSEFIEANPEEYYDNLVSAEEEDATDAADNAAEEAAAEIKPNSSSKP